MRVYPLPNPFLALRSFSREDAKRFYGRDADLVLIQSRLYSARTTLLFAGSGVGKTSLIDARLRPLLETRWLVVTHRSWAARPPLETLCEAIATSLSTAGLESMAPLEQLERYAAASGALRQHLLILDQFEEVFQHWRDSKALDGFAQEVARLVHATTIDARVLFSMREEFLGELSVFDNSIPDLFNNCYRLKNPTRAEAEEIIEKTSLSEQRVECGSGLEGLLDDLLSAPRTISRSSVDMAPSARSRIPMPFLQIVCHRLWEKELGRQHEPMTAFPDQFLKAHTSGQAAKELDGYCREKLEALNEAEREIAAAAFSFLMTPAGAKMAYPIDVLATQARVAEVQLEAVLKKLSAPDVRILREIPAGRGSKPWVELYHDLYARFLSDWKRAHDRAREEERARRQTQEQEQRLALAELQAVADYARRRRLLVYDRLKKGAPLLFVLAVILFLSASDYVGRYVPLYRFAADAAAEPETEAYLRARRSVDDLKYSIFSRLARSLWARYWHQRAQREMLSGAPELAILSQMRSLQEVDDEQRRRQLNSWLGLGEALRTFRAPEPIMSFGFLPKANRVYAMFSGCRIVQWDRTTTKPLPMWVPGPAIPPCNSVSAISPDGRYATLLGLAVDGSQQLTVSVVSLESNAVRWSARGSAFSRIDASFSPDSEGVVAQVEGRVILVSTSNGAARQLEPLAATEVERSSADYRYSPFTGSLIARFPQRIVVLPPDGSGAGREISLANAMSEYPELAQPNVPLVPLPRDRFIAVTATKLLLLSVAEPIQEIAHLQSSVGAVTPQGYSVTSDGSHVFLRLTRTDFLGDSTVGLCRLATETPSCEAFAWPLGEFMGGFDATSPQAIIVADLSGQTLREVKLATSPGIGPAEAWSPAALSADGRWMISGEASGCFLVDFESAAQKRQVAPQCTGNEFAFSPSGAWLLDVGRAGEPPAVIDPATLQRHALSGGQQNARWLSGDYVAVETSDGTTELFNAATKTVEAVDPSIKFAFLPSLQSNFLPCAPWAGPVLVSPDGRYAAVAESEGLAEYRKSSGTWSARQLIPNAPQPCETAFSPDSSRMLALLNGNVISVWKTSDGAGVRSLTDRFRPLNTPRFGVGSESVIAIAGEPQSLELVLWQIDGSEVPAFRVTLPPNPLLISHSASRAFAVTAGRMLLWLTPSESGEVSMLARPMPRQADLWPPVMSARGVVRRLMPAEDGKWVTLTFDPSLADVEPITLPQSKSWLDVRNDWSQRLDVYLDEGTGLYTPGPTANAPPAAAPLR